MKKLLLTLGATAAIAAPVASVVACGSGSGSGTTPGQAGPAITKVLPKAHVESDESTLMKFNVSEGAEDAHIDGFLGDVSHAPRNFKVYDNGLFQIKIEKRLIGPGKFFASEEKALLEAKDVVKGINIGPAIAHLPKGIQILYSDKAASLGGNAGVQIATNNKQGSADDAGLHNFSSLISHEYGHHETMWDLQNLMNVDVSGMSKDTSMKNFKDYMVNGLRAAGYPAIANICDAYNPSAPLDMSFGDADQADMPNGYPGINAAGHQIFTSSQYPFNPAEITTRALNILSFRTDLSAQDMYTTGKNGTFYNGGLFEPAAAFVSDATIRHFAKTSIFGNGTDNTNAPKLIDFYMKSVFGRGQANVQLLGNISKNNHIDGLKLSSFGATPGLDTIEVVDSGTNAVVASSKVTSFKSKFGFKDQLISDHYATTFDDEVQTLDNLPLDLDLGSGSYKIVGKDKTGAEVDLTSMKIGGVYEASSGMMYTQKRLEHNGRYLDFSTTA